MCLELSVGIVGTDVFSIRYTAFKAMLPDYKPVGSDDEVLNEL